MTGDHDGFVDVLRVLNVSLAGGVLGLILCALAAYMTAMRLRRRLSPPSGWNEVRPDPSHPLLTGLGAAILVVYAMVGQADRLGTPFTFRAPLAAAGEVLVGWSMLQVLRFQRRLIAALQERIRFEEGREVTGPRSSPS